MIRKRATALAAALGAGVAILLTAPAALADGPVSLSGVVRDGAGVPLAGALVGLVQPFPSTAGASTFAGADGSYSLAVAPGSYGLNLGSGGPGPGGAWGLQGPTNLDLSASRVQDVTVPLLTVTVRVVDSAGVPVANASVHASQSGGFNVQPFPGYLITQGNIDSFGSTGGSGQAALRWLPTSSTGFGLGSTVTPPAGSGLPSASFTIPAVSTDTSITVRLLGHQDTAPPLLHLPGNLTTEATGPSGATVSFTATATDNFDPSPSVSCLPASGSTFPLGTTQVACVAQDASGNSANGGFSVTVRDTTAPVWTPLPSDMIVDATGPNGAVVTYTAAAVDAVDTHPSVSGSPASGSTFAFGSTTVTLTATDAAGNSSVKTFTIYVRNAPEQLTALMALVDSYQLGKLGSSFDDKLTTVARFVADGKLSQANETLSAFVANVEAQSGKGLTAAQATSLSSAATRIQHVLGF
jgi:HYR domain